MALTAVADESPAARSPAELRRQTIACLEAAPARTGWDHHHARMEAAAGLWHLQRDRARAAVGACFESERPKDNRIWEREAAIRIIGEIGDPELFPWVRAALEADDPDVKFEALSALPSVARGRQKEASALARAIFDRPPDSLLKRAAALALDEDRRHKR